MEAYRSLLPAAVSGKLLSLVDALDERGLAWLAGYVAGRLGPAQTIGAKVADVTLVVTILYATETGNARRLAKGYRSALQAEGCSARSVSAGEYKTQNLKRERFVVAVVNTHGDGDPPDHALELVEYLQTPRAPRLEGLAYAPCLRSAIRAIRATARPVGGRMPGSRSWAQRRLLSAASATWISTPLPNFGGERRCNRSTRLRLPPHPLTEHGYVSIGDVHTTRRLRAGMTEAETRIFGLKRKCGLHWDDSDPASPTRAPSPTR